MKIIFLDIDGVLNSYNTMIERYAIWKLTGLRILEIDDQMLKRLSTIVKETNAKVVLSSTWKSFFKNVNHKIIPLIDKGEELLNKLESVGIELYDITPNYNMKRGIEITTWLENHDGVESFVIIDDEIADIENYYYDEVVKTKFGSEYDREDLGLLDYHVNLSIEKLNKRKTMSL